MIKLTLLLLHPTCSSTLKLALADPPLMNLGPNTWLITSSRRWSRPNSKTFGFQEILANF